LAEFTGERVIPGQVDIDLMNEHLARYAFAARLARGKRVLDAGCGTGYGSAELAKVAASVLGVDVASEAVNFARAHYRLPYLSFEQASTTALPHPDGCFDLVVAFEVIEHLRDWREFLVEARRVLAPSGQFIVSTPNKLYYAESRGAGGDNPFHVHEFEFEEFRSELRSVFPDVALFLENHTEGVTFQPHERGNTVEVRVDAGEQAPQETHFFVAVCAHRPQLGNPTFVYVPRAGNVLRERGQHIALLEREVAAKNEWLEEAERQHQELLAAHDRQKEELERSNQWAEALNRELEERRERVAQLQAELVEQQAAAGQVAEGYAAKVRELEGDLEAKAQWARDTQAELDRAAAALNRLQTEFDERTAWALRLNQEVRQLEEQLGQLRASRWMKLGHKVGLGPELPPS
jgi:SAM-dependent methyltransferase